MKQSFQLSFQKLSLTLIGLMLTAITFAQDSSGSSSSTTTTTTTEKMWYMQPWAWVVGGIVLLLIIILAARGSGNKTNSSDRVTVTKTVTRDDNM